MIYLLLCLEFAKIGIFAIGGGLVTLPFLYDLSASYNWFSIEQLTHMIALSSITPGPIGINAATYTGFATAKIAGALIASLALVMPSFIITSCVAKILKKYKESFCLASIMTFLLPASSALLFICFIDMSKISLLNASKTFIDLPSFCLLAFLTFLYFKFKNRPFLVIFISALLGLCIF